MKVLESVAPVWSLQRKELMQAEVGESFIEYLELWCTTAERLYDEGNSDTSIKSARSCLLEAMVVPEQQLGHVDGTFLGPMLMYIIHAWVHGQELGEQLSEIEIKIVASAIREQQEKLQERAATTDPGS